MAEMVERKKKTRGRQKIEMKLIEDKEDRVITFSKRKAGIFKKASEISVMCGAKVLFILFSPVGKAYSFCHPNVKSVVDRFYGREETDGKQIREILENHLNNKVENLVLHHQMIKGEIEATNGQVPALGTANNFQNKGWWEADINEMNSEQEVKQVLKSVLDLQVALSHQFEKLKMHNVAQGGNSYNPVDATYDPVGDVNNFLQMNDYVQMTNWNGGNLPSVGGLGEFDNSLQGVNQNLAVDPSVVGFGGNTVDLGYPFSLTEAGFEGVLDQGNNLSLPSGWYGMGFEGTFSSADKSGVGKSGGKFGDPGDSFCGSGFDGTLINGLPDPLLGFQESFP